MRRDFRDQRPIESIDHGEPHWTIRTRIPRARKLLEKALDKVADDPKILASTQGDPDSWVAKIRTTTHAPATSSPR